jgi:hypothetical protein
LEENIVDNTTAISVCLKGRDVHFLF